jgi:hypothetical protein
MERPSHHPMGCDGLAGSPVRIWIDDQEHGRTSRPGALNFARETST